MEDGQKSAFQSFAPWDISRATFQQLLDLYPATLKESYKRKLIEVAARKHRKHPERLNEQDPAFERRTTDYAKVDEWRYQTIPQVMRDREHGKEEAATENDIKTGASQLEQGESYDSLFMHRDELVQLMEWKLSVFTSLVLFLPSWWCSFLMVFPLDDFSSR